jgi:hypothetical protein
MISLWAWYLQNIWLLVGILVNFIELIYEFENSSARVIIRARKTIWRCLRTRVPEFCTYSSFIVDIEISHSLLFDWLLFTILGEPRPLGGSRGVTILQKWEPSLSQKTHVLVLVSQKEIFLKQKHSSLCDSMSRFFWYCLSK